MIKSLIRQWKSHPYGTMILLLGYVIGILIVSVGTGIIQQARQYALDAVSGDPSHYALMHVVQPANVHRSESSYQILDQVLREFSKQAEIQINFDNANLSDIRHPHTVIGVFYANIPEWQPPLLQGRYITPAETLSSQHTVVLGENIAHTLFPNGINDSSYMTINHEQYHVVGVIGRKNRGMQWDEAIYMPFPAIPKELQVNEYPSYNLFIRTNGQNPISTVQLISDQLKRAIPSWETTLDNEQQNQNSPYQQMWNSVIGVGLLAGIVLLVSSINVSNLTYFWVLDRRREISIRKALGATDFSVISLILLEIISLAILAASIACFLHLCSLPILFHVGIEAEMSWQGVLLSFGIALLCGVLTSIKPIMTTLQMKPVDLIRS